MPSGLVVSNSLQPRATVAQLFCPWDSPGKNTVVSCHALLQGIFLTQGTMSPASPALQVEFLLLCLLGSAHTTLILAKRLRSNSKELQDIIYILQVVFYL